MRNTETDGGLGKKAWTTEKYVLAVRCKWQGSDENLHLESNSE